MFTMVTQSSRRVVSAVAAVAVVAFAGLALDQGHLGGLPEASVEVGQLTPVDVMQMAALTLPEVTVTAKRVPVAQVAERGAVLPEIVVVASRNVQLAEATLPVATPG